MKGNHQPLLRRRDGKHARVTNEELFFDLVYAFAITQLSHLLLHRLDWLGAVDTLILWFAMWLGWQYVCWITNWFDPETPKVRGMLFAVMPLTLVIAAALPEAFGERGLIFALAYAAMQVGCAGWSLWDLRGGHPLRMNYLRIFCWMVIAACFWIAGGLAEPMARRALWLGGVACIYISPMIGFWLPGLGRSRTEEWTIDGAHLAERCQCFVIVALGESVLATGGGFAEGKDWSPVLVAALVVNFITTLTLWWLYFGTSSRAANAKIEHAADPGAIGAQFHYVHALLVGGIVAAAVGHDLVIEAPLEHAEWRDLLALGAGPGLYLLGSTLYKRVVYGHWPLSHLIAMAVLVLALPLGHEQPRLAVEAALAVVLLGAALREYVVRREKHEKPAHQ
ncbi:low temperature requirement protein A [Novosphingobium rosa]|uniref:low temperature requirement protein A n=1 Tax=Novosphingobium rosa TaxID=76978 RepID=UPI0008323234|nr:low temperature requirement protein A [Novosphingobium rosa]